MKVIEAEALSAGYGGNVIWGGANFSVDQGEFVAVIGPNGAGKTTLFRLLLGLQRPLAGSIRVFGAEPERGSPRIGYVPQAHNIDEQSHIESLELVRLGISGTRWGFSLFSQDDKRAALSALESVGATELAHRPLAELSGGELQRIFLAEALVSSPDMLLLDEPLSNLDMRREKDLLRLVNGVVRSRNVTVVLIAHDINPLLPYLDRVIYIANGKVASGRPEEVLTSDRLTAMYETSIEVLRDSKGNVAIIGIEEGLGDK
ncbi:MAG: ABC transporter ATP-binding protein [Nitrososphaerota archaeon]|jgi:zinc/manganese transport system ATP-binding protein|nr:ABC transporter ATP-binding protein [Nitrososphaerota archaeon]